MIDKETYTRIVRNMHLLLEAVKLAYRKHHLNDDSIGWEELSDKLRDALCEVMGDDRFCKWLDSMGKEGSK